MTYVSWTMDCPWGVILRKGISQPAFRDFFLIWAFFLAAVDFFGAVFRVVLLGLVFPVPSRFTHSVILPGSTGS